MRLEAAGTKLCRSLQGLKQLLDTAHLRHGCCGPELCQEVLQALTALLRRAAVPLLRSLVQQQAGGTAGEQQQQQQHEHQHQHHQRATRALLQDLAGLISELLLQLCSGLTTQQLEACQGLPAAAADAILAATSVLAPYSSPSNGSSPSSSSPSSAQYTAIPSPLDAPATPSTHRSSYSQAPAPASSSGGSSSKALAACLAAAQALMKHAPAAALGQLYPALLPMALRLLSTAPAGPQLTASQQFLEACFSSAAQRHKQDGGLGEAAVAAVARSALAAADAAAAEAQQAGSSSSAADAGRLGPLLSSMLLGLSAAAALQQQQQQQQQQVRALQQHCFAVVRRALGAAPGSTASSNGSSVAAAAGGGGGGSAAAAAKALEAVRGFLQECVPEPAGSPKAATARALLAAAGPPAVALAHAAMHQCLFPLAGPPLAAVSEALKALVVAASLVAPDGQAAQEALMRVLVPLLVEVAAPAPPGVPTPALRELALKLVTALPSAAAGPAFKAVLAAQPPELKQRLQGALRESQAAAAGGAAGPAAAAGAAGAAGGAGAGGAGAKKPSIALKMNFALPAPQ